MSVTDIKNLMFWHHPVQAKYLNFNSYSYILYYLSDMIYKLTPDPLVTLIKEFILICKGVVGTVFQQNS